MKRSFSSNTVGFPSEDRELSPEYDQASTLNKGYGRVERRVLISTTKLNGYLDWPGVQQVCRVERTVTKKELKEVKALKEKGAGSKQEKANLEATRTHRKIYRYVDAMLEILDGCIPKCSERNPLGEAKLRTALWNQLIPLNDTEQEAAMQITVDEKGAEHVILETAKSGQQTEKLDHVKTASCGHSSLPETHLGRRLPSSCAMPKAVNKVLNDQFALQSDSECPVYITAALRKSYPRENNQYPNKSIDAAMLATCPNCLDTYRKNCNLIFVSMPELEGLKKPTTNDVYKIGAFSLHEVNKGWFIRKPGKDPEKVSSIDGLGDRAFIIPNVD